MGLPFWRYYQPGVHLPVKYHPGIPMVTLWNDGNGYRPVTDIEWSMFFAFCRFNDIVSAANNKLDKILTEDQNG